MKNAKNVKSLTSTNDYMKAYTKECHVDDGFVIYTDFQSKGKGQTGNVWNSQKGKNLLFSMVLSSLHIPINKQFILSQIISIAIVNTLSKYIENVKIKWPNDIYWNDKKVGGILIENTLQGNHIKQSVIGVGLNVNQTAFNNSLTNPISIKQVKGKSTNRTKLLQEIRDNFMQLYNEINEFEIKRSYISLLYRNTGLHPYINENNYIFYAEIHDVASDGCLHLKTSQGEIKTFYFKEVVFKL